MGPFAAAAIAGADPMKTGWSCFRFAKVIYVMPRAIRLHAYSPHRHASENIAAIASATLGVVLFSIVSTGFFYTKTTLLQWLVLAAATVLAFVPALASGLAAVALFAAVYLWQRKRAGVVARRSADPSVDVATK